MNLYDGLKDKTVIETNYVKSLTIDGIKKDYKVYDIKLEKVFYNDQNDRIATWVNKYKIENNIKEFNIDERESYNNLIHNFIVDSNQAAINKTLNNIKMIGQQEYGVVLSDGRIIDGNRRYTCLRAIQKEDSVSQYFKAVILDYDIEYNKKQIKMLELQLQHGVDEKVGYNPIDRLVGVYNDIIETRLLTPEEYANSVNRNIKEIKDEIRMATLMVEFLEMINMDKQFHIAKEMNLFDPLKEVNKIISKVTDEDTKDEIKKVLFIQLLMSEGDKTRYIRSINKIVDNKKGIEKFIDDQSEIVEDIIEKICDHDVLDSAKVAEIRSDNKSTYELKRITEKYVSKANSETTKNQPSKSLDKVIDNLEVIDTNLLMKLNEQQLDEFRSKLEMVDGIVKEIKSKLDV